mmetsp:Transcript_39277/g.51786  ORF Transcript_39277/g.51786 Transcript_39277/m.51786 type:complete len:162 (-) Transcript_39277:759-1244(-)
MIPVLWLKFNHIELLVLVLALRRNNSPQYTAHNEDFTQTCWSTFVGFGLVLVGGTLLEDGCGAAASGCCMGEGSTLPGALSADVHFHDGLHARRVHHAPGNPSYHRGRVYFRLCAGVLERFAICSTGCLAGGRHWEFHCVHGCAEVPERVRDELAEGDRWR